MFGNSVIPMKEFTETRQQETRNKSLNINETVSKSCRYNHNYLIK